MMVTLLIIGILSALIIPSFNKARSASNASAVISTAQAYQAAVEQFKHDHNGRVPVPTSSAACTAQAATADWELCGGNAKWGPRDPLARANGQSTGTSFAAGSYVREIPELVSSGKVGICFRLQGLYPAPGSDPTCAVANVNGWFIYEPFVAPGTRVNGAYAIHVFARARSKDTPTYSCTLGALRVSAPDVMTPKACTQ